MTPPGMILPLSPALSFIAFSHRVYEQNYQANDFTQLQNPLTTAATNGEDAPDDSHARFTVRGITFRNGQNAGRPAGLNYHTV